MISSIGGHSASRTRMSRTTVLRAGADSVASIADYFLGWCPVVRLEAPVVVILYPGSYPPPPPTLFSSRSLSLSAEPDTRRMVTCVYARPALSKSAWLTTLSRYAKRYWRAAIVGHRRHWALGRPPMRSSPGRTRWSRFSCPLASWVAFESAHILVLVHHCLPSSSCS